jgi:hypothetical protein
MIVAPQYYDGDVAPSMSLARLLADIEPSRRDDITLALVSQPGTQLTPLVKATADHCSAKFNVEILQSPFGGQGHPEGCTALWAGTAKLYYDKWKAGNLKSNCIFMLDANDTIPLHRDWISLSLAEHSRTLSQGKLISGTPYFLGTCPLHINPNAIFELSVFEKTRFITDVPKHDGTLATHFDIYHREEMLAHCCPSSIVHTDWRGNNQAATRELLTEHSKHSIWLHGYKDPGIHFLARDHLFGSRCAPKLHHYDLESLRTHEMIRRCYEGTCA